MKIDLDKVDTERFRVREKDGLTLINPDAAMWDWRDDELHMRSLLCRDDGEVVSAGYPKFFNYGERKDHPQIWQDYNKRTITYKEDGTLIIASLIDDKLHLRTRGNHDLGDFHDRVWNVVRRKSLDIQLEILIRKIARNHPCLTEKVSVLMEYVAPDNLIVMKYNKEDLVMLGVSIYSDNEIEIKNSEFLAFSMPSQTHALVHEVDESIQSSGQSFVEYVSKFSRNIEGFVVNLRHHADDIYDVRNLIKFKTEWYIRLHGLMTETESRIDELLFFERIFTEERFLSYFQGLGYDWETCMFLLDNKGARAKMDAMKARIELVKSAIIVGRRMKDDLDKGFATRKDIALHLRNNLPKETHGVIFGLLDSKHEMPAMAHIAGVSAASLKAKKDLPPLDMILNYE
jgi:hypothetical protein